MNVYKTTCDCGQPVAVKIAGQCKRCYNRRWMSEHYVPTQPREGGVDLAPCTYQHAHYKVFRERGKANAFTCSDCPGVSSEWHYKGGSAYEQTGVLYRGQARREVAVKWSPDVQAYDAVCRTCRILRTRKAGAS